MTSENIPSDIDLTRRRIELRHPDREIITILSLAAWFLRSRADKASP